MPVEQEQERQKLYNKVYPLIESIIFTMKYPLTNSEKIAYVITDEIVKKYPTVSVFDKNHNEIYAEIIQKLDEALKKQYEEEKRIAEQSKKELSHNVVHAIVYELKRLIMSNKLSVIVTPEMRQEIIGEVARRLEQLPSKIKQKNFSRVVCEELVQARDRLFARRRREGNDPATAKTMLRSKL